MFCRFAPTSKWALLQLQSKKMFGYPKIQYGGYRANASNSIEEGRGNLRIAKTPPLQSALAGMPLRSKCRPIAATMRILCTPHALPPKEILRFLERRGTPRRYGLREIELRD